MSRGGVRKFATTADEEYELDLSAIRRVVSVSVTLDWFPATGMCWRQLYSASLVTDRERPTVHLSLADLMVLSEVLAGPATLVHYFWRRSEWEEHVSYLGDEEDLLVYDLSEGLFIADPLRDQSAAMNLHGRSDELHRHYTAPSPAHGESCRSGGRRSCAGPSRGRSPRSGTSRACCSTSAIRNKSRSPQGFKS